MVSWIVDETAGREVIVIVISGDSIVSAVSDAIKAELPDIAIHSEDIIQGVNPPYFFVFIRNVVCTQVMEGRAARNYQVAVRYHPESKEAKLTGILSIFCKLYPYLPISRARIAIPLEASTTLALAS
jgi:hypothetical protein